MNNQVILWSMLIVPLATLFLMKQEDFKRFISVALLSVIITAIVMETGITLGWWNIRQTIYPLNQTLPYIYGLAPVVTLWMFKYTFRRFWWYIGIDTGINLFFAYVFTPWLVSRGIKDFMTSSLNLFLIITGLSILLYLYQLWKEDELPDRSFVFSGIEAAHKPDYHREEQH